jgi:predicted transcriptional regulator
MLPELEEPEQNFHLLSNMISANDKFQPDPKVLSRLGQAFYEKGSLKRSHLHLFSRTNWPSLKKYIDWLGKGGYLEYDENNEQYKPTEGGWTLFRLISLFYDHIDFKKANHLTLI